MKKFNIISLGCAKNLVDSEILLGGLKETQLSITDNPDEADTIIVNTCGFLDIAREESIETIIAAIGKDKKEIIHESTDLLFFLLVMWSESGIIPEDIYDELAKREGVSGLIEKKGRI